MMNNNGFRPYYRRTMNWNSLFIAVGTGSILWVLKLIFAAVMYLVNTLPPMQADVNSLKHDVADLKIAQQESKAALKVAADNARTELGDTEKRLKLEFTKLLNEQMNTIPVQTGPSPKRPKQ